MMKRLIVVIAVLIPCASARAQSGYIALDSVSPPAALAAPVTLRTAGEPLRVAVSDIARQANVSIAFDPALPGLDHTVAAAFERVAAAKALLRLLDGSNIQAMASTTGAIVLSARAKHDAAPRLAGTVQQADGGGPIAGVHLSLVGTRFETMTDVAGRFNFGVVPAGTYSLRATRMGFAPIATSAQTGGGAPLGLSMTPAAVPVGEVIVTPGYYGVMQPSLARSQTLTRLQIETVPQLGEDVYRTISRLPGVAADDFTAKFSVRGESVDAVYVTLDGLPLVEPYHLRDIGGALSIVDLAALGQAELIAGGPSAEYGDETAGVFTLHSVDPRPDRMRTSVGLSISNVRAMTQGGFANGKGAWLVSARRGYLELVLKLANVSDSLSPRYDDVFAKVTYNLPGNTQLGVHALHAGDGIKYLNKSSPSVNSHYLTDYAWLTLEGRVGPHLREQTVAWVNALDWRRGGDQLISPDSRDAVYIRDIRALHTTGARQDWSLDMGPHALLKAGVELTHSLARYDYDRRWTHVVSSGDTIVRPTDTTSVHLAPESDATGFYLSQRIRPFDALTLEAGARYDRVTHTNESYVSPRFNASWQVLGGTTLRASYGKHSQSQSVFDIQVENGVRAFQPAEHAKQFGVGLDQTAWNGLVLRVEAYDRRVTNLRSIYVNTLGFQDPFTEIATDLAQLPPSPAKARGVEVTIERDAGHNVDWSASYVRSSSLMQLSGAWVPRATDQPTAVRGDWSFHPADNSWRLTVSGVAHTGWPFTPENVKVDTIRTGPNKGIWELHSPGDLYSGRVSAYRRVDARWTRFIDTHDGGRVALFIDIFNFLNNSNQRSQGTTVIYSSRGSVLAQENRLNLPRIPSFGINWEF